MAAATVHAQREGRVMVVRLDNPPRNFMTGAMVEELHALVTCLADVLSELESSVLSLYLDGYSYEVVAERLDCDTKTVDNALQRVKRKIATHLASREVPV